MRDARSFFVLKPLFLVFLLISIRTFLLAQNDYLRFDHFTSLDGLSENAVFAITQDKNGFIWFGTRSGLNKFDGYSFVTYKYDRDNPFSIGGNEVISLIEDSNGDLWIGTRDEGISRLVYSSQKFYRYESKWLDGKQVDFTTANSIYQNVDSTIVVATNGGLIFYDTNEDQFITTTNSVLAKANVRSISGSSRDNCIWIGTKTGAYLFNITNQEIVQEYRHKSYDQASLSSDYVTAILEDKSGRIWFGTYQHGLNKLENLNDSTFSRYQSIKNDETSLTSDVIRLISQDKNGAIWIGTKVALEELTFKQQSLEKPSFIHHEHEDNMVHSLSHNSIYSFFEDKNGDFWVGTYNGGVNFLYNGIKKFQHYKHDFYDPTSLNNSTINAFETDEKGVWIGTNAGLEFWDRKARVFRDFNEDLRRISGYKKHRIKALKYDQRGNLWIGTNYGLCSYDSMTLDFDLIIPGLEVITIENGLSDEIWIGSSNGLKVLNTQTRKIRDYRFEKSDSNSLSNSSVKKIFRQKNGSIWVGTKRGLNRYQRESDSFVRYISTKEKKSSISDSQITSICEDNDGDVWVGTFNGVNLYDSLTDRFIAYEGLVPNNIVLNIIADDEGGLWMTTTKELVKFRKGADGELSMVNIYDRRDGLQDKEFKLGASFKTDSGELLFGGVDGFNVLDPKILKDNPKIPDIVFTDLKLFNKSVEIGAKGSPIKQHINTAQSIELTHEQSIVSFCYASLNYVSPSKNQYAYILEGFEDHWNYVGDRREAIYTSLPPGSYVFKVKGSNNDGLWSPEGASLTVIVHPPWWETWWFRLLIVLTSFVAFGSIIYYRFRLLNKTKRYLEYKIAERTKELEEAFNKLKDTQSQLVQSEKMASIGLLTSGVAHEINNPLNFIQGSKNFISDYVDKKLVDHKPELLPMLEAIQLGLDRTSTIVSSLNRFNRKKINYDEKCDMHLIIDDCLVILQSRLRDRIKVERQYTQHRAILQGNEGELHQLILNVLSNAEQSMKGTGSIDIQTDINKDGFLIQISDTGEGISVENIKKVTDPFFTTKAPGKGVGLGMSISFSIVEKHNGTLSFDSEMNLGTTVAITLPLTR